MALERSGELAAMESRDRAFARNIAATSLRRLGQIDALIDGCLERPLKGKAKVIKNLIRLGVCQLLFLSTPSHAAVDTTIRLAQSRGFGPYKKLINAVLRRLSREGQECLKSQDAARLNTPDWMWDSWTAAYGSDTCRLIAEAHLDEASLDLTLKEGDPSDWARRLKAQVLSTGSLRIDHPGDIRNLDGFKDGDWWVQDAAAALPVRLLGDVRGMKVIDLCAAPGGKTAQLAAAGAEVIAVDRSSKRLMRLEDNLRRLHLNATTVTADAVTWRADAPADAVLVDVPCTATGTIRRHPDVPQLKQPSHIDKLAAVQRRLLNAAIEMVKPGGLVVYACCSLQPEEGPGQVNSILNGGAPLSRQAVKPDEIGGLNEIINDQGDLRCLPCHLSGDGGMDGFYAARLRRL